MDGMEISNSACAKHSPFASVNHRGFSISSILSTESCVCKDNDRFKKLQDNNQNVLPTGRQFNGGIEAASNQLYYPSARDDSSSSGIGSSTNWLPDSKNENVLPITDNVLHGGKVHSIR